MKVVEVENGAAFICCDYLVKVVSYIYALKQNKEA